MAEEVQDIEFATPPPLAFDGVSLHLEETVPADHEKGFVPVYRFAIRNSDNQRVGRISFKVGDVEHIRAFAGHIGYGIVEEHRGHGCAARACQALRPFIARYYDEIVMTSDPDNAASLRTIEKIGAEFVEEVDVPTPSFVSSEHETLRKRRYVWKVRG
jgi:predicted acetyltransferase